jgi:hypothetical protein
MENGQYSPRRIADRLEIVDRLYQFAHRVDRKDWDLVREVYHSNGGDHHGTFNGSAIEFGEFTRKRHENVLSSMHHLTNVLSEFIDDDTALVESYLIAWQSVGPGGEDLRG